MSSSKKTQKEKEITRVSKIICGSSLHELQKMPNDSVDAIITSPPYFQQRNYLDEKYSHFEIGIETILNLYLRRLGVIFSECVRVCKPTGNIVFNLGDKYIDKCLMMIPYRFAIRAIDDNDVFLVNDITWVKSNPTPRQYDRRLVSSTEPFFHFAKTDDYYYDRDAFLYEEPKKKVVTNKKGSAYFDKIYQSDLSSPERLAAKKALHRAIQETIDGKISNFRMKIRGVHKLAFGGQQGGRNNEIKNNGFTIIKMTGKKMKRDILESPVADSKNIDHPAIFPLQVIKELVSLLSPEDGIILDPFCGSGTTCLAAKELRRKYIGIDLSEKYCEISRERLL